MGKNNVLYCVHAGTQGQAYCPVVYETTKQDKAYKYISDLEKSETNYTKIYVEKRPLTVHDKRRDWDD